jgi:spore coat polysaccharide biosynthesis protein SpsF
MNNAIFISVRTGSSRLPQKALLKIDKKHTIEYVIERAKKCKKADLVVLCTSELKEDDILCELAKKHQIKYFRGSEMDRLERWHGAIKEFDVEFFVTFDGDDLFCEPILADMAFKQYKKNKTDFIESKKVIVGSFTSGISAKALKKVCKIKNTDDTEMSWLYFTNTGLFKVEELENIPEIFIRDDMRMTLDYEEDFLFFKTVVEHFDNIGKKDYNLLDIVSFLIANPSVSSINEFRNKDWKNNQNKKVKLILKD